MTNNIGLAPINNVEPVLFKGKVISIVKVVGDNMIPLKEKDMKTIWSDEFIHLHDTIKTPMENTFNSSSLNTISRSIEVGEMTMEYFILYAPAIIVKKWLNKNNIKPKDLSLISRMMILTIRHDILIRYENWEEMIQSTLKECTDKDMLMINITDYITVAYTVCTGSRFKYKYRELLSTILSLITYTYNNDYYYAKMLITDTIFNK